MFDHTSRYAALASATLTATDGRKIAYKRRRFLPRGEKMQLLVEVMVTEGERLDRITARVLGDPEQFWRVCDANTVMHPEELTEEVGQRIRIPVPQV